MTDDQLEDAPWTSFLRPSRAWPLGGMAIAFGAIVTDFEAVALPLRWWAFGAFGIVFLAWPWFRLSPRRLLGAAVLTLLPVSAIVWAQVQGAPPAVVAAPLTLHGLFKS